MTPDGFNEMKEAGLLTSFASVTGALSYLLQVYEGKRFSWFGFCIHFSVSALAGFLTYLFLHHWATPPDLAGALCGIAGWMGTRMMRIVEILVYRRYGVEPNALKQKHEEETKQ